MDVVKKILPIFLSTAFLISCGNQRTAESVLSLGDSVCQSQEVKNEFLVYWNDGHVSIEKDIDRETFLKNFVTEKLDKIARVEHNHKIYLEKGFGFVNNSSSSSPGIAESNNPLNNDVNWGDQDIHADVAWAQGYRGQGVKVAVVDSGVDINHPQLVHQIDYNTAEIPNNGIDDDGNGYIDDYAGYNFYADNDDVSASLDSADNCDHGTHVSGIIAAEHSDNTISHDYPQGVAPEAKIIPVKFIHGTQGGTTADALRAIDYAVTRGANVINASWGGSDCNQELENKIAGLKAKNILFIAAAGNSGRNIDQFPEFPAAFTSGDSQITVGASTVYEGMAYFSNFGSQRVDLFAPGLNILSTFPNDSYQYEDGTSMATPFVTGAAAVVWGKNSRLNYSQVKNALLNSVTVDNRYVNKTHGRLNLEAALNLVAPK